jgi:hypothetical protein
MSYFNHAFKKTFVATKQTQSGAAVANVTNGFLVQDDVHVSELKNQAAPYVLGPGVVGLFSSKTHLSISASTVASSCCPFYLGGASIKLDDKQGPYHGGYQESNKSKIINPKFIRKLWKVKGNAGSQAMLQMGDIYSWVEDRVTALSIAVVGTGYVDAENVAVTGGSGTGLTVDIVTVAGDVTGVTINNAGSGYAATDTGLVITGGGADATVDVDTVGDDHVAEICDKEFLCGESYYLRVDVKGTPALRFANHNLYRTLQADGGCCADPSNPEAVNKLAIYMQWANQIINDPYLKDFITPVVVVEGVSYAADADMATLLGLTDVFSDLPAESDEVSLILVGAYYDTTFENCTFQISDYYHKEPIQLYASEVDLNGDPCEFQSLCVEEICPGIQANGLGEQKVRELILSESYLQNFMHSDLRIREVTQGTRAYEILTRSDIYSSFYILHSVPRYNNPSGVFDNDQYLLEIVTSDAGVDTLETAFETIIDACSSCNEVEDNSAVTTCDFNLPTA